MEKSGVIFPVSKWSESNERKIEIEWMYIEEQHKKKIQPKNAIEKLKMERTTKKKIAENRIFDVSLYESRNQNDHTECSRNNNKKSTPIYQNIRKWFASRSGRTIAATHYLALYILSHEPTAKLNWLDVLRAAHTHTHTKWERVKYMTTDERRTEQQKNSTSKIRINLQCRAF